MRFEAVSSEGEPDFCEENNDMLISALQKGGKKRTIYGLQLHNYAGGVLHTTGEILRLVLVDSGVVWVLPKGEPSLCFLVCPLSASSSNIILFLVTPGVVLSCSISFSFVMGMYDLTAGGGEETNVWIFL